MRVYICWEMNKHNNIYIPGSFAVLLGSLGLTIILPLTHRKATIQFGTPWIETWFMKTSYWATWRSEFEDGLGSGDFVLGYSYHMSVRTRLSDHTKQTKFQSQRPNDFETPAPSILSTEVQQHRDSQYLDGWPPRVISPFKEQCWLKLLATGRGAVLYHIVRNWSKCVSWTRRVSVAKCWCQHIYITSGYSHFTHDRKKYWCYMHLTCYTKFGLIYKKTGGRRNTYGSVVRTPTRTVVRTPMRTVGKTSTVKYIYSEDLHLMCIQKTYTKLCVFRRPTLNYV
jgi:hypothetical protein